MIKVTVGARSWTADDMTAFPPDAQQAMIACYQSGGKPIIENLDAEPVSPAPVYSVGWADRTKDVVDERARERIAAERAAVAGALGRALPEGLGISEGTRMMKLGYDVQAERKREHDAKAPFSQVAEQVLALVGGEKRRDIEVSAGELARDIRANGRIYARDFALSEAAIRGLAGRLESPMLTYVLGIRDRVASDAKHAMAQADRDLIAEVLRHELKRAPDVKLKLRCRESLRDVYAILSPGYAVADATTLLPELLKVAPKDAKATFAYDPGPTQWDLRTYVWTPTPVDDQAIGEPFEGFTSYRSRDNGTSRFTGEGGINILACYNAGTVEMRDGKSSRIHRGRVMADIPAMMHDATRSIRALTLAWGAAREHVIPLTPAEKKIGDAFIADLFKSLLAEKPFAGVLAGRTVEHAKGLAVAYKGERRDRDEDRVNVADLAQAWTKYIQAEPSGAVRRDAESAVGRWVVDGTKLSGAYANRMVLA